MTNPAIFLSSGADHAKLGVLLLKIGHCTGSVFQEYRKIPQIKNEVKPV